MLFLILVLSGDDEILLLSLFDSTNNQMYNVAYKVLGNSTDAEDALQEAFIRMMQNIEKIKNIPCPKRVPYCVIIVKNVSKNMLRSRKLHINIDEIGDLAADASPDPEDEFYAKVDAEYLVQSIDKLRGQDRDMLLMKWAKEMGYSEISTALGISEDAAAKRGQRALKKLKEIYLEGLDDE